MTNGILLTRHNQEIAQWSPDPFPRERVGSGHETRHNQEIAQWSPDPFPRERVGSGHETRHNQEIAQWSPDPFPRERVGSGHETMKCPILGAAVHVILLVAMCILFCSCLCTVCSKVSDS